MFVSSLGGKISEYTISPAAIKQRFGPSVIATRYDGSAYWLFL